MSTGLLGFFGVGVESSFGQNSNTPGDFVPIISENLTITPENLEMQGLTAKYDSQGMLAGLQRIQGTVSMEVHPCAFGHFLRCAFDTHTTVPGSSGGFEAAICNSNANWRVHRFIAAQNQFQSGSGSDLPTMTATIYRGPINIAQSNPSSAFAYFNVTANRMEMTIEAGQLNKVNVDMLGRDYARVAAVVPTFQNLGASQAFVWHQASLSIGGGGSAIFQSLTFVLNNNMDAIPKIDGRKRPDLIKRQNFRQVEVNGRLTFQNDTDYDLFTNNSETPLRLFFQSGSFGLLLDAPSFRYMTFPIGLPGPGVLSIDFTGRAMWNAGSGTALAITLVNTRVNNYHVNSNA